MRRTTVVLCLALLALHALAPAAGASPGTSSSPRYALTDLGTLGGTASFALGIGRDGTVVGTSRTGGGFRPQIAFAWNGGEVRSLGTLPGATFSRAFAVNARGVAVGEAFTAPPEQSRPVRFIDGRVEDLGVLPGAGGGVANDVNSRGIVAGASGGQPVVWRGAGAEPLPPLVEGGTGRANALNARGQVAGQTTSTERSATGAAVIHAFRATSRGGRWTVTDLGSLGGATFSTAYDINDRGVVVGESVPRAGEDTYRAVAWRGADPVDLGTLDGLRHSRANAVNVQGDVVGHATGFYGFPTIDGRAVIWRDGHVIDLNTAVEGSDWVLRSAEDIDVAGRIVGYGTVAGQTRAFLLTPVR